MLLALWTTQPDTFSGLALTHDHRERNINNKASNTCKEREREDKRVAP